MTSKEALVDLMDKYHNSIIEEYYKTGMSKETRDELYDKYEPCFKAIEQDLEVLKILQVLILHNGKSVGYKGIIRDFEVMLRLGKITKEQLDKLKQWLEENENETQEN